jgi:putative membrane protein
MPHSQVHAHPVFLPALVVGLIASAYVLLALREKNAQRAWSRWRLAAFLSGSFLLALGFLPQCLPYATGDFRKHMLQHLLIGMLAPIGLVMAAPVSLILRSVPSRLGKAIIRLLRSRPLFLLANPITALLLDFGGLAIMYFTPVYVRAMSHPALQHLLHLHFLAAGCLFTWVIAGPDPAPHRPSVPMRLLVLGVAITAHSILAQMMYAGAFVAVPVSVPELQGGATLMYYGGDIAEILLAFALVTTWRPIHGQTAKSVAQRQVA